MNIAALLTLAVIGGVVYALATDRFAPSLTLLTAVVVLMVLGVITPAQAFSGFSNPAPITVAALFIVAGAVDRTGALQPLVHAALGRVSGTRQMLVRLLAPTAGASAFLNNTPIVAMLAPQVSGWAAKRGLSPSRFLMPLSFASILGGMVTLIGTSTNIVVSGLLEASGHEPIGMFELTRIGGPAALVGLGLVVLLAPVVLRDRRSAMEQVSEEARSFVFSMEVVAGGPVDGETIEGAELRNLAGVYLAEIERDRELMAPVSPVTTLRGGDLLTFVGRVDQVVDLQRRRGLVSTEQDHCLPFHTPSHTFFEAVIGGSSPLVGRTLKEASFRARYQAAVMAIHRSGRRVEEKLGQVRLKVGDTLLILSDQGFRDRWRDRSDFLLVSQLGGTAPPATRKAGLVGLVVAAMVGLAAAGVLPMLHAALLAALALLALGVLTPGQARAAVDLDVLIVIAAAFGLGAALEESGLAAALAHGLVHALGGFGPIGVVLGILLATTLLTELVTNNAAAVLLFPIAMAVAAAAGLEPRELAMAVAVMASASFLTPIGYQTNIMVYGPGGYSFTDYLRLGLPLNLVVMGTVLWIVVATG
jgi:di/tricarboxylate transporter